MRRQRALHFAEAVVRTVHTHRTRLGPDLERVVVLDVREVLLPRRRQVDEVLAVSLPAKPAGRAVGALVVLALVPEDPADAVREFRLRTRHSSRP